MSLNNKEQVMKVRDEERVKKSKMRNIKERVRAMKYIKKTKLKRK